MGKPCAQSVSAEAEPQWRNCLSPTHIFQYCVAKYFSFHGLHSHLHHLPTTNTTKTTIATWLPKHRTHKPVLVLLHAFGVNSLTWGRQIATFSSAFDLFIPDLLFSGLSTTTGPDRSETFQAECVFRMLQELGVDEFSVVGTSYGGFVGYRMAHMYPSSVRKLVVSSSAVNMTRETDEKMARRFGTEDVKEILQPRDVDGVRRMTVLAFRRQLPFRIPGFICNDVLNVIFNVNRKEKLELLEGLQLRKTDAPPLPKISQETLLIWGEYDPVFDVSYARRLKEWIGDNTDLVILKDAAHAPQAEVAQEYNKKVLEFLTRPLRGEHPPSEASSLHID